MQIAVVWEANGICLRGPLASKAVLAVSSSCPQRVLWGCTEAAEFDWAEAKCNGVCGVLALEDLYGLTKGSFWVELWDLWVHWSMSSVHHVFFWTRGVR